MYCNYFKYFCFLLMLFAISKAEIVDENECRSAPCRHTLKSCNEAVRDGVYLIEIPASGLKPFYAYCMLDASGNGPWTLVQRRMDGSQNFYRNWQDYINGFGNLYSDFFIGLDILHTLTYTQPHELWIQLGNKAGEMRSANYTHFAIGDEKTKYALNVLGEYSGNAGDSLTHHAGRKFTTKDQNNNGDDFGENCAVKYTGAWWYRYCHRSNLNGQYGIDTLGKGVNWYSWTGDLYSLKYVHMAIRPIRT